MVSFHTAESGCRNSLKTSVVSVLIGTNALLRLYLHNYGMRNVAAGSVDWLLLKEVRGRNVRTAGGLTWSITEVNSKKTT